MNIVTADEMYNIEKTAEKEFLINEEILMENASFAVFSWVSENFNRETNTAVLCGPGNNGGDGFATARQLYSKGYNVTIFMNKENSKYSGAGLLNYNIIKKLQIPVIYFENVENFDGFSLIIDALFGAGLNREVSGIYKDIIEKANKSNAYKLSVDVPSGIKADSPVAYNTIFKADTTITFSALKICHTLYPAKNFSGNVICKNISIPENIINHNSRRTFITKSNLPKLKVRNLDSHKGTYGKAVLLGGSYSMAGAVKISSISALNSGCGIVICMHHKDIDRNFISDYPEIITKEFDYNNMEKAVEFINNNASSLSIGGGMGKSSDVEKFVKLLLESVKVPIVLDADGINTVSADFLQYIENKNIIITPHLKEFANLLNTTVDEVINNKLQLAEEFTDKTKITLVLKSSDTIIASPDNKTYILNYGNTALSKGGSGDALTGLITGILAQKYSLTDASILSSYIIGNSAEIAVKFKNTLTIKITDIINHYSEVLNEL